MYIVPTVTDLSNFSPVLPSQSSVCPDFGNLASSNISVTSFSLAPSKTGVDIGTPFIKFSHRSENSFFDNFSIEFPRISCP